IKELAYYDALTGLPNRRLLETQIAQLLDTAQQTGQYVAVLYLDLDRFKNINDSFGHADGDALLREVAARIRNLVRSGGVAGRLHGDEFVVASLRAAEEKVSSLIERWQAHLMPPLQLPQAQGDLSVCVGVAMYPQDGKVITSLLHRAEMAMQ